MILKYRPSISLSRNTERITRTLNALKDINATSEFIDEAPRHYLITIQLPDNVTNQDILEIGALCGALDKAH